MNGERQRRECEFRLLRYVPDAVRNEYVHIGVILREAAAEEQPGRSEVRFTHDWRRVSASIRTPTRRCSKAWRASCGGGSRILLSIKSRRGG